MAQYIAFYGNQGVGKTTVASNIAAALVETGFTVLLVGCDRDGDSCSPLLEGRHSEAYKICWRAELS